MISLNPLARLITPDGKSGPDAINRTTHLGIGAHQDDLEFMAFHGILACYDCTDRWFGGVTITDGRGSGAVAVGVHGISSGSSGSSGSGSSGSGQRAVVIVVGEQS